MKFYFHSLPAEVTLPIRRIARVTIILSIEAISDPM
jgi:hypothetical protein